MKPRILGATRTPSGQARRVQLQTYGGVNRPKTANRPQVGSLAAVLRSGSLLVALGMTAVVSIGCDAAFEDLRPIVPSPDFGFAESTPDAGSPEGRLDADATVGADASTGVDAEPAGERALFFGTFRRVDYDISGRADIVDVGGQLELRLADDFSSFPVPGPVLVLTTRDRIGSTIRPDLGDIRIGALRSNRGAQIYQLPPEAANASFLWNYCEPFGLEVGVAPLEPAN